MKKNSVLKIKPHHVQSNQAKIVWASSNVTPLPFDIFQILVLSLIASVKVDKNLNVCYQD